MPQQPPKLSPLTEEHAVILDRALQSCADVEELLNACEGCDMATKEALQRVHAQRSFCEKVKQQFFPGRT